MCKWRIRRKYLTKKVHWGGGGGGGWELQDLSSFVLGENYLCIVYENIQEAFFSCSGNSRILDYTVSALSIFVRSAW